MIIIDTSAAYFPGDDENSNVENGAYARMQRTLVKLAGHPTVLALCHPVKHAAKDNLLPRGGGAYLNEVDGNLTAYGDRPMAEMHWQGKFRGADFDPIHFEMITVKSPRITDAKGRIIPTVAAKHLSAKEQSERVKEVTNDQDSLMVAMLENDGASISDLAAALGWLMAMTPPTRARFKNCWRCWRRTRLSASSGIAGP